MPDFTIKIQICILLQWKSYVLMSKTSKIYFSFFSSVFRICMLLTFATIISSCNHKSNNGKPLNPAATHLNETYFEELHKKTYQDPLAARTEALAAMENLSDQDLVSKIKLLKYIGSSYVFETNYPDAITHYNKALALAESINFYNEIGNINNNLGMIFNELGDFKNSYTYYSIAIENYTRTDNREKKTGTYNNIGVIYLSLNNYDKALSYFEKALDTTFVHKDTILVATIYNNLAICYIKEQPEKAFESLHKAISLSHQVNNQYGLCISYQIMGNNYLNSDDLENALDAYNTSVEIAKKANLTHQLANANIGLARVKLQMNAIDEAFEAAFEVMKAAKENNSLVLKSEAHHVLSDIFEKNQDYENSLLNYKAHVKAQQELTNQTVVNQIYDVELNYLNRINKMQLLELETKELAISKKNNLLFFISLIFILLLLGFYLIYRNYQHKQKVTFQNTVIELNKKRTKAALEAEIQERKRIGEELHDSLGYLLSLAALNASVLEKRKDLTETKRKDLIKSLMESIEEAFDEVRNISHNLAPTLLSEQGLKGALKSIADKINQSTKIKVSYDTFGLENKLDEVIENVLYRTLQEIVNNTIKHANASELFIQIVQDNSQITVMAEDNGQGFQTTGLQEKFSGLGLSHIKSSIENLNGSIYIDSKEKRGTIISIVIPLQ